MKEKEEEEEKEREEKWREISWKKEKEEEEKEEKIMCIWEIVKKGLQLSQGFDKWMKSS